MQIQMLFVAMLMLIAVPVMLLFSNHNVFFILLSIILFVSSFKKISDFLILDKDAKHNSFSDEELFEEIEEALNIDVARFYMGLNFIKDLIIIMFFIYCFSFMISIFAKSFIVLNIIFYVCHILINSQNNAKFLKHFIKKYIFDISPIFMNFNTLLIIVFSVNEKYLLNIF